MYVILLHALCVQKQLLAFNTYHLFTCTSGGRNITLPLHETLHSRAGLVTRHGQAKCDSVFMTVVDLT